MPTTAIETGEEHKGGLHLPHLPVDLDTVNKLVTVPDWISLHPLLANYFAESVGTFIFALTVALVTNNNPDVEPDANVTALPVGFMLMSMVFAFGYISGGHFNPAVTFAVLFTHKEGRVKMLG